MAPGPIAPLRAGSRRERVGARGGLAGLLMALTACVEIDPSYADSYTTTTVAASDSSGSSSDDGTSAGDASSTGLGACECGPLELCEAGACTQPARVLFVNLDGVTLTFGFPDASQNSHNLYEDLAGTWDPYDGDRPALLSALAEQWAAYRVVVTDVRPEAGPYLMVVVSSTPPPPAYSWGTTIGFPDCGEMIPQDVGFVFASGSDGFGAEVHAALVSNAFGRGLGLRYTNAPDDIMGFGTRFTETCHPIAEAVCEAHQAALCGGDLMQQSSHGELAALLGLRP